MVSHLLTSAQYHFIRIYLTTEVPPSPRALYNPWRPFLFRKGNLFCTSEDMKALTITSFLLFFSCSPDPKIVLSSDEPVINNNIHSVNSLGHSFKEATLDKVKLIRHVPSGKCLVIENQDRWARRGDQIVLWECHDVKHIAGLEQEMFTFVKGYDNGYMMLGLAGSIDHCPFTGRDYYDTLEIDKCNPLNAYQSWTFRRVEGTVDQFQITHLVSGRCLRVASPHDGSWVRSGDCNLNDPDQSWRICGLDNDCTFTI